MRTLILIVIGLVGYPLAAQAQSSSYHGGWQEQEFVCLPLRDRRTLITQGPGGTESHDCNDDVDSDCDDEDRFNVYRKTSYESLDFAAAKGTEIYAVTGGSVIDICSDASCNDGPNGNFVRIQTPDGTDSVIETVYVHMDTVNVSMPANISAGQPLGTVGDTGAADGVHLHFGIIRREDGEPDVRRTLRTSIAIALNYPVRADAQDDFDFDADRHRRVVPPVGFHADDGRFILDPVGGSDTSLINRNNFPVLPDATPGAPQVLPQTATIGIPFRYQFATVSSPCAPDIDTDTLIYRARQNEGAFALPPWLSFDATRRTFAGTPRAGDLGTLMIFISVTDPASDFLPAENNFGYGVFPLTVTSTLDINGDGTIQAQDAQILYYLAQPEESLSEERRTMLLDNLRGQMSIDELHAREATWRAQTSIPDVNLDGDTDQQDAQVLYYAHRFEDLMRASPSLLEAILGDLAPNPAEALDNAGILFNPR